MSRARAERPDTYAILTLLKDFQRSTVEYVFDRMYRDHPPARRFLVADEVGLGKTLVARGLVAKIVDHLWDEVARIDVVYVCANTNIARQNVKRLGVQADAEVALASRLTLLPVTLPKISENKINFVAFTPGTSFDLRSSEGIWQERALLYHLLHQAWGFRHRRGPFRALQGTVDDRDDWVQRVLEYGRNRSIEPGLQAAFVEAVEREDAARQARGEETFGAAFEDVADELSRRRHTSRQLARRRAEVVGGLRALLAQTCLRSLEPDLVILDEFQRFRRLLRGDDDMACLARSLFEYHDDAGNACRVLLLSATPYKMYTRAVEPGEDHYRDFLQTVEFLHDEPGRTSALEQRIAAYRHALFHLAAESVDELRAAKRAIETDLRHIMVRNERLQVAGRPVPMLVEAPRHSVRLEASDLEAYCGLDALATALSAGDQVEYWKSAPYLPNFMESYELKRALRDALSDPQRRWTLADMGTAVSDGLLRWSDIEAYTAIDPANARLRALVEHEVSVGWPLLWIPASLPYYEGGGPFTDPDALRLSKVLAFSSWKVVPKAIATLASLEAERRMVRELDQDVGYTELPRRRRPLLRFTEEVRRAAQGATGDDDGDEPYRRLTGMPVFTLLFPSAALARLVDPLVLAGRLRQLGAEVSCEAIVDAAAERIAPLVEGLVSEQEPSPGGPADEAWYWSALAQMEGGYAPAGLLPWLDAADDRLGWTSMVRLGPDEDRSLFDLHVRAFRAHIDRARALGRTPDDLTRVLATIAVASPAVCVLRALMRLWPDDAVAAMPEARAAAARVAMAVRGLFNLPETTTLIRGRYLSGDDDRTPYWRLALAYALHGNLQAVIDEYAHVLRDALGLFEGNVAANCLEMGTAMAEAISIRTVRLEFDEVDLAASQAEDGERSLVQRSLRSRYAMRFGSDRSDDGSETTREDQVRVAFNSPFRPFVLATTSIGQEGLDFHWYCHRIYHWNLPGNPVDLEQREGRIDRYKGHAIRRNIALAHGDQVLVEAASEAGVVADPWRRMFELARWRPDRPADCNELDPWWVYRVEDGAAIERHVPILPLTRDALVLADLKASLVAYRLVFGQPRQEDLVAFLRRRIPEDLLEEVLRECRIDRLAPTWRP